MKRRWWFMGLFAPQAVGQTKSVVITGTDTTRLATAEEIDAGRRRNGLFYFDGTRATPPYISKPANNICPQCGTVAPVFTRPKPEPCTSYVSNMPTSSGPYLADHPPCPPEHTVVMAKYRENLVRCANCNSAFWQDAV